MAGKELEKILERVPSWPDEVQDKVLALLELLEEQMQQPYELTPEDEAAIQRGIADADAGRFATDAEMQELFARFRLK